MRTSGMDNVFHSAIMPHQKVTRTPLKARIRSCYCLWPDSGTGKSALAREIAKRRGGIVLDKDPIRATLFGAEVEYTAEQDILLSISCCKPPRGFSPATGSAW